MDDIVTAGVFPSARSSVASAAWSWLRLLVSTSRNRRALAQLDARQLDDLGFCPAKVAEEVSRNILDVNPARDLRR